MKQKQPNTVWTSYCPLVLCSLISAHQTYFGMSNLLPRLQIFWNLVCKCADFQVSRRRHSCGLHGLIKHLLSLDDKGLPSSDESQEPWSHRNHCQCSWALQHCMCRGKTHHYDSLVRQLTTLGRVLIPWWCLLSSFRITVRVSLEPSVSTSL